MILTLFCLYTHNHTHTRAHTHTHTLVRHCPLNCPLERPRLKNLLNPCWLQADEVWRQFFFCQRKHEIEAEGRTSSCQLSQSVSWWPTSSSSSSSPFPSSPSVSPSPHHQPITCQTTGWPCCLSPHWRHTLLKVTRTPSWWQSCRQQTNNQPITQ